VVLAAKRSQLPEEKEVVVPEGVDAEVG